MALDLLSCMASFVAIVEHNGFAKAARQTYTSPSVLSKQIKWLEETLGKNLFTRTTRRLELTPAGKIYLQHVKEVLGGIQAAKDALNNLEQEPHGELTVGIPAIFKSIFFLKKFQSFLLKYPKIILRTINLYSPSVLIDNQADVIITTANVNDKQFIKRKLFSSKRIIVASPTYLKKHGTPKTVADLKKHNCLINEMVSPNHEWEFTNNQKIIVTGNYISDSSIDIIFAAIHGMGLITATKMLVREELANGQLVEVALETSPFNKSAYLYHLPCNQGSNIQLFANCMTRALEVFSED